MLAWKDPSPACASHRLSGAVKVTPAHNHVDYKLAQRHNLPFVSVIAENGTMTAECGEWVQVSPFLEFVTAGFHSASLNRWCGLFSFFRGWWVIVPSEEATQPVAIVKQMPPSSFGHGRFLFQGLHRFLAREKVLAALKEKGLYRGAKDHCLVLPICR